MARISIGRRTFIVGAAAAGFVAAACGDDDDRQAEPRDTASSTTTTRSGAGGLALKGINYDTDRETWRPEFVPHEIETISRDLHCNSIFLLGSDLDRLTMSADIAADNGLHVWFEPRHFDSDAAETLEFVAAVARAAEELRAEHPDVGLSLGVELTIFMDGLVPGSDWSERGDALGRPESAGYNTRLNDFLAGALPTIRPIFAGQLTYSSGTWEEVDWSGFDVVGVDLYRDVTNEATFVDDVRNLHRHGKPVVITEFGCCAFQGAEDMGGTGFLVVDFSGEVPIVAEDLVRDEQVQANYISELLDVFEAEQVHGAFIYDFIEPDSPYSTDPRFDFDMAGFAVVKCYPSESELAYDRTGHFEPKAAFDTIARRFG